MPRHGYSCRLAVSIFDTPEEDAMIRLKSLLLAGLLALCGAVQAQTYPDKPVHLVVPFTPAGSTTLLARMISEYLSPLYGQQVLVENKPGAGAHLGAEFVARAP